MEQTASTLRFLQKENARLQQENASLRDEVSNLKDYIAALGDLGRAAQAITSEVALRPLLQRVLYSALSVVDAADGSLLLLDEETGELAFVVVQGQVATELPGYRLAPGEGIAGWVAEHRQAVIVNDPAHDPRFFPGVDQLFGFETRCLLAVPLAVADKVVGVIEVVNKFSPEGFTAADVHLLTLLADLAATAIMAAAAAPEPAAA